MLISNSNKPAKPSVPFIIYGILKGYVQYPLVIFLISVIRARGINRKLNKNLPGDIKQLLSLTIGLHLSLKACLDPARALALTKAVIIPVGLINQMAIFRFVEEPNHDFNNLIKQAKIFKAEGPMRLNKYSVMEQNGSQYHFKVHNCVFINSFLESGCPELCSIFCGVDHALYNIYSPNLISFSRGGRNKTISSGNKTCDFICEMIDNG